MNKAAKAGVNAVKDGKFILVRGLPKASTARDLQRALLQADVKGVSDVELHYRHFRPTGKAVLTLALPDYARDAARRLRSVTILGANVTVEPVDTPESFGIKPAESWQFAALGDGPSAGAFPGRTVTLYGFPGKTTISTIRSIIQDAKLAKTKGHPPVQFVRMPEKKFSMVSRFCVHLESESEAHKLVRRLHMTPYKGQEGAQLIKAEIIY